jgi:MoxR-like ATPase
VILADEINRTPPKTQAALLQAMQEKQVTAGGQTHTLEAPFFVLATQNPIEQEGTYPLPEAQLDRGAGPRATIALLMAAKARALLHRRCHATTADLAAVAHPVLRHRLILTFNAEAAGVDADAILTRILEATKSFQKAGVEGKTSAK